jgi:hypothetical protein
VDPQNPIKPSAHSVRGGVLASRHHALNRGRREKALNRLYVPLSWTGDQLVYSLLAEIPIQKRAQLTYRKLYRRFAGMAIENAPGGTTPPPFNLEPDLESHASTLSWPGTRGIANMQLHFKTASWVGEMWLMLQSETEKRQSIRVGFKEGVVMVRADHLADRPLAVHKLPRLERGPLDAWLRVQNQVLTLRINGRLLPPIDLLQVEAPKEGLVQFYIQDKVRGTAQAAGVDLHLTVLP